MLLYRPRLLSKRLVRQGTTWRTYRFRQKLQWNQIWTHDLHTFRKVLYQLHHYNFLLSGKGDPANILATNFPAPLGGRDHRTGCVQNQIEILKYPFSAASERLSDNIIVKDQSKMEWSYKSCFSLRLSWAPPDQIVDSQFVPPLPLPPLW
jgi:hypothetical protein